MLGDMSLLPHPAFRFGLQIKGFTEACLRHRHCSGVIRVCDDARLLLWSSEAFPLSVPTALVYPAFKKADWLLTYDATYVCGGKGGGGTPGEAGCIVPCEAWLPAPPGNNSCLSCPALGPVCSPSSTSIVFRTQTPITEGF